MADGDLYSLTVHLLNEDQPVSFSMGYEQDGGTYGIETGLAVCVKFTADYLPKLLLCLTDDVTVDQLFFNPIGISTELAGFANLSGAVGGILGEPLPSNMAALVHLPTVAPNSKHNGRIYLPGIPEASIVGGVISVAQLALIQTWATQMFVDIVPAAPEDATFKPIVISRFVGGVKRVPPIGFDILEPVAKNEVRQQRRRTTRRRGLS